MHQAHGCVCDLNVKCRQKTIQQSRKFQELVAVTFKKLLAILCNEFITGPTGKLLWREVAFLCNDI